jgi:anti-repressor protein
MANENVKEIKRIGVTEILGKEIEFYGSWEEPYFLAKSVAEWIEHSNTSKMLNNVDEDEKVKAILPITNGYTQDSSHGGLRNNTEMLFLTEDGLYEVLMQSRKPIAKPLKKKIKQYLKQIRKTGGTVEEGREEEFINKYFPSFSEDVKIAMVQDLLKTNKELKPKADYHDEVLNPTDENFKKLLTASEIAKDLGMSAQKFNKTLNELHIIYKKSKTWMLYAEYEHMIPEYFDYHITEYGQTLKYKEKGRKWIIELLKENQIIK